MKTRDVIHCGTFGVEVARSYRPLRAPITFGRTKVLLSSTPKVLRVVGSNTRSASGRAAVQAMRA